MNRTRIFIVSVIRATNTRGARIKITDSYYDSKLIASWNCESPYIWEQAQKILEEKGIKITSISCGKNEDYLITDDFETRIIDGDK